MPFLGIQIQPNQNLSTRMDQYSEYDTLNGKMLLKKYETSHNNFLNQTGQSTKSQTSTHHAINR